MAQSHQLPRTHNIIFPVCCGARFLCSKGVVQQPQQPPCRLEFAPQEEWFWIIDSGRLVTMAFDGMVISITMLAGISTRRTHQPPREKWRWWPMILCSPFPYNVAQDSSSGGGVCLNEIEVHCFSAGWNALIARMGRWGSPNWSDNPCPPLAVTRISSIIGNSSRWTQHTAAAIEEVRRC